MIRVELLSRRRSPWSKALLSALVVCGGLYGIHHFFPALAGSLFSADSALNPAAQQEVASSPVVQQETTSEPVAQQETTPNPVVQQETTPEPEAQQETTPNPEREVASSPIVQQETTPSPVQEIDHKSVTQQETTTSSSPVQEATPTSVAQQEDTSSPVVAAPRPATPAPTTSQAPSSQRSTACHQVMRIDEQVPAGIRVASLNCNSTGEYWLEGTSPSHKVLRQFRLRLQALPSWVSFSTWYEERTLRFLFQGRFTGRDTPPLAAISSGQAEQFFGKVAHWAKASGLDSLSIHEPIHWALPLARTHQRQKLRGIGSPQQIGAFLHHFQQAESVATLGEVLLMPVKSDERGWVQARLYAAVDIVVDTP